MMDGKDSLAATCRKLAEILILMQTPISLKRLLEKTVVRAGYPLSPALRKQDLPGAASSEVIALLNDVPANGLQVKILMDDKGRIVDGVTRLAVMLIAGLKISDDDFVVVADRGVEAMRTLVVQLNVNRRHYSNSQLALIFARMEADGMEFYREDLKARGTSAESVARAKRVLNAGDQSVIDAVQSGEMAVSAAARRVSDRIPYGEVNSIEAGDSDVAFPNSDTVDAESKPSKRGRPPGNVHVNAWERGFRELGKIKDHHNEITTYWRPKPEQVADYENMIAICNDVLRSVKRRSK